MKKLFVLILFSISVTGCVEDSDNACLYCDPVDPSLQPKEYKLEFSGHGSPEQTVHLFTYSDGSQEMSSLLINDNIYKSTTLSAHSKIGFKLISTDGGQVLIDTVKITDVESNQVLFEDHNLQVTFSKTIMYTITDDTYIVQ